MILGNLAGSAEENGNATSVTKAFEPFVLTSILDLRGSPGDSPLSASPDHPRTPGRNWPGPASKFSTGYVMVRRYVSPLRALPHALPTTHVHSVYNCTRARILQRR